MSVHPLGLLRVCLEAAQYLAEAVRHGARNQLDQTKTTVEIRLADMRAQLLRFFEGLRPLGIVHIDLAPRRGKKHRRRVVARGCPPGVGSAASAVAQVADQIRQAAIEETSSVPGAVRELRLHSRAAFLCEPPQIAPRKQPAFAGKLFAYQRSRGFFVADLARSGQRVEQGAFTGTWASCNDESLRGGANTLCASLPQRHK